MMVTFDQTTPGAKAKKDTKLETKIRKKVTFGLWHKGHIKTSDEDIA